jgi:hypothetical protein
MVLDTLLERTIQNAPPEETRIRGLSQKKKGRRVLIINEPGACPYTQIGCDGDSAQCYFTNTLPDNCPLMNVGEAIEELKKVE